MITVAEFIKKLQTYPKDKEVYAYCSDKKLYFPELCINERVDGIEISCHEEYDLH